MKANKSAIGVGLLTAIASSLCCITPLLAVLAGTTGLVATFQWGDITHQEASNSLQIFADEIMPQFSEAPVKAQV